MRIRTVLGNLVLILIPLLLVEGVFRLLPVSYPPYIMAVDEQNPIAHFQPNREYWFSKGGNFAIKARKRTNNFGYNNENDYDQNATSPLLMVIGDSYVEAHQVDAGQSAAELLHSSLDGQGRVYSIGLSGAPLSQYLMFAEYSRTTFRPDSMAFVIIGNDFDESLLKYSASPRFYYFKETGDGLALQRVDYETSLTKRLLRRSAFVRYVIFNLEGKSVLAGLLARDPDEPPEYVGNVSAHVADERMNDSRRAVDEFLRQLPGRSGLSPRHILFVMDGARPALYSREAAEAAAGSFYVQMKRYFAQAARAQGYEVIDMEPRFIERHRRDGSRFEFATDGHWNELGHRLVAEAIRTSAVFESTFDTPTDPLVSTSPSR